MIRVLLLLIVTCIAACIAEKQTPATLVVPTSSDSLIYEGRIKHERDSSTIYYSGSGITFRFRGTSVSATLRDETGDCYFNVIIDGQLHYIRPDTIRHLIQVNNSPLKDTVHTVSILKRNEWANGRTWFYGLTLDGKLLPPPPARSRTIEFIGNSITAGYAIDDNTGGDSPDSVYTNNYYTYAAITARHFDANYYCTARSGIGIMISWFPVVMPDVYERLDPFDSTSSWDFVSAQPDIIVVNLFQNDSWLVKMPEYETFKQQFGKKAPSDSQIVSAYKSFISRVRILNPNAHIICALGSMDATKEGSPWPGYVTQAVKELNDSKMYTYFFPYMQKGGHPRRADNQKMAQGLIKFIEQQIWR